MKKKWVHSIIALSMAGLTLNAYAAPGDSSPNANLISAATTQANTKTYTLITVGGGEPAKVTVDTGSSMLVLEEKFIKNYRTAPTNNAVTMGYGNGAKIVHGTVVYADVTLNTRPKITAQDVPVLMVPNGTFQGHAGIMGVEMNNQTSVWKHLPDPYNQMMVIDGPHATVTFGTLPDDQVNAYAKVKLGKARCNNSVKPEPAYANITCWSTRRIPVTYIFKSQDGQVAFKARYNTVFDTGGILTHFFLQPIPAKLQSLVQNQNLNGQLNMRLESNNQGTIDLPATQAVKVFKSKRNVVNSGYQVFAEKSVLFDARDGVIGFQ